MYFHMLRYRQSVFDDTSSRYMCVEYVAETLAQFETIGFFALSRNDHDVS